MTDESQAHELKHECMKPNRWFFQLIVQIETTNRLLRSTDVIQSSATPTNTSISSVLVCNAANVSLLHWLRVPERIMYTSQRPSTILSVWTTPASRWPWVKAEAAIVINFSTGCSVHVTIHDRRPRLYCRRAAHMEQSAWLTAPTVIVGTIQETSENSFI